MYVVHCGMSWQLVINQLNLSYMYAMILESLSFSLAQYTHTQIGWIWQSATFIYYMFVVSL